MVGAARNPGAVGESVTAAADSIVSLSGSDPASELRAAGGGGFDVVVDPLGGDYLALAIGVTNPGARLVNFGSSAGIEATLNLKALQGRRLIGHTSMAVDPEAKRQAYASLADLAVAGEISIPHEVFALKDVGSAWEQLGESPHRKIVIALPTSG